jgi:glycogen operon protein
VVDDSFVLIFNAHDESIEFTLPPAEYSKAWSMVIDTAASADDLVPAGIKPAEATVEASGTVTVGARALVVLQGTD